MNSPVKFKYLVKDANNNIFTEVLTIQEIESTDFGRQKPHWQEIIARSRFTGLIDKAGIEVYEGDVVLAKNSDEGRRKRFYIHYQDLQAEWQFGNKKEWGITSMYYINKHSIEVIGSIYETPELLEANNE